MQGKRGCGGSPAPHSSCQLHRRCQVVPKGRSLLEGEFLSCVLIWYLEHSLMSPIVTSCVSWPARQHGNFTSPTLGCRTPRTRSSSVSTPPTLAHWLRWQCQRVNRLRRAALLDRVSPNSH